jgi:hypothetical protein
VTIRSRSGYRSARPDGRSAGLSRWAARTARTRRTGRPPAAVAPCRSPRVVPAPPRAARRHAGVRTRASRPRDRVRRRSRPNSRPRPGSRTPARARSPVAWHAAAPPAVAHARPPYSVPRSHSVGGWPVFKAIYSVPRPDLKCALVPLGLADQLAPQPGGSGAGFSCPSCCLGSLGRNEESRPGS